MTLASGGKSDVSACGPLASSAITPVGSVHKSRGDNVVQLEEVCGFCRGGHRGDECVLASTLCKYDLRKGDLFVLSWARVRRGSLSSELLMCGGCGCSILLLSLVVRCLETIDVSIWRMFVV